MKSNTEDLEKYISYQKSREGGAAVLSFYTKGQNVLQTRFNLRAKIDGCKL